MKKDQDESKIWLKDVKPVRSVCKVLWNKIYEKSFENLVSSSTCYVTLSERVSMISVGDGYFMINTNSGNVYTFGDNSYGQLGLPNIEYAPQLQLVNTLGIEADQAPIVFISAGFHHAAAIASDGSLYCWGWNEHQQCGIYCQGRDNPQEKKKGLQKTLEKESVSSLSSQTLDISSPSRSVGSISFPNCTPRSIVCPPQKIRVRGETEIPFFRVACGRQHSLVVSQEKVPRVFVTGRNDCGQCAHSVTAYSCVPQFTPIEASRAVWMQNEDEDEVAEVYAGWKHSAVRTGKGRVYVWGSGSYMQLGGETVTPRQALPLQVDCAPIEQMDLGAWNTTMVVQGGAPALYYGWLGDEHRPPQPGLQILIRKNEFRSVEKKSKKRKWQSQNQTKGLKMMHKSAALPRGKRPKSEKFSTGMSSGIKDKTMVTRAEVSEENFLALLSEKVVRVTSGTHQIVLQCERDVSDGLVRIFGPRHGSPIFGLKDDAQVGKKRLGGKDRQTNPMIAFFQNLEDDGTDKDPMAKRELEFRQEAAPKSKKNDSSLMSRELCSAFSLGRDKEEEVKSLQKDAIRWGRAFFPPLHPSQPCQYLFSTGSSGIVLCTTILSP